MEAEQTNKLEGISIGLKKKKKQNKNQNDLIFRSPGSHSKHQIHFLWNDAY